MISPDSNGLYHPGTVQDIIDLVKYAGTNKLKVRVRGAAQSPAGAVYTDNYTPANAGTGINMELDQFRSITCNDTLMQVTVGGGINLGYDPFDPSKVSAQDNSNNLFYQLNKKGWAIPNVTNAIHQTVAGFISTGSEAGSMAHSFEDCILSITLIDGTGNMQVFNKSQDMNDPFYAAGLSLGLFGIIISVTLQCSPAFNIIGTETVTKTTDCTYDFFGPGGNGKDSLQTYISNAEFSRTLWWPITSLQRVISWQARTMQASDYNNQTGPVTNFKPKPYQPLFHKILGTHNISESAASAGFTLMGDWPNWLQDLLGHSAEENTDDEKAAIDLFQKLAPYLYPMVADFFFPLNTSLKPPQQFWDNWLGSLPMDQLEYGTTMFNISFTELWFPIDQTQKAIDALNSFFTANGYKATGFYTFEILAGKSSNFWMSPGYQQNSMRFNILFFNNGAQITPAQFYSQFWAMLQAAGINFRLHWGKVLPGANTSTGPAYFKAQYPKWDDFMALRTKYDPQNIFLNTYWQTQLGISS